MEQMISRSDAFGTASIDDHWILEQLFGIKHLETKVKRGLSSSRGKVDDSVLRAAAELKSWVARFEKVLDAKNASQSTVLRARAS